MASRNRRQSRFQSLRFTEAAMPRSAIHQRRRARDRCRVQRCAATGEIGEIVIHGPQVFVGYWGHEDATEKAFVTIDDKRFLRTGDLGYRDEDGYFFIMDRLKRMINASGYKVWPAELEAVMFHHPGYRRFVSSVSAIRIAAKLSRPWCAQEAWDELTEQNIIDGRERRSARTRRPALLSLWKRCQKMRPARSCGVSFRMPSYRDPLRHRRRSEISRESLK